MKNHFSQKNINRLTLYHCILEDYIVKDIAYISSPKIASLLNIDDSQVRKDIKLLNNIGRRKIGYLVKDFKAAIEQALGFKTAKDAFIVGAGNLGWALAKYSNFSNYGLNILALFDNDTLKINLTVNDKKIFHISKLPDLVKRLKVEIVILTVPRQFAQDTATFLINSGIKYIWNFTPCILDVPKDIQVWNENLVGNFLQFTIKNKAGNE